MDLGIAGRKAIVCASSRGLGRACAFALAQAGCGDSKPNPAKDGSKLPTTGPSKDKMGSPAPPPPPPP